MTQPPPALASQPQFTALYWDKAPRSKLKVKLSGIIQHVTEDEQIIEFIFDNGNAFKRNQAEIDPGINLHVNQLVYVETIGGELVTGLWVPEQGWAFRMTSEDLAEYAKKLTVAMHKKRQQAQAQMTSYMSLAIELGLRDQTSLTGPEADSRRFYIDGPVDLDRLAKFVMQALQQDEPSSSANT